MKKHQALKQLSNSLEGLQGGLLIFPSGANEFLFTYGYALHYKEVEALKLPLEDLGLYNVIREALVSSEALGHEGKYDEAAKVVLDANRKLFRATGEEDDLRSRYKAVND